MNINHAYRTALLACNIVSPKKVDGIQKFLTKTDILQIAKHKEIDIMEKALKDKHEELAKMVDDTNGNGCISRLQLIWEVCCEINMCGFEEEESP